MKRILLLTAVLLTAVLHVCAEKTAQALWCEDNTTLYLTYDETAYAAGGQYNGQTITTVSTDFGTATAAPQWNEIVNLYVTEVVIDASFADYKPTSCREWFAGCTELTTITGLTNLNTEDVTSMHHMFYDCQRLTAIDLSNFNTAKVTDMSGMFQACLKVTELDVTKFNTSNVVNMSHMFSMSDTSSGIAKNNALATLDVSKFNTEKVTTMDGMFYSCLLVTTLDVSKFDTRNVTNMSNMFYYCRQVTALDVSKFNTEKVTDMSNMFRGCQNVETLDVSKFVTDNVTKMNSMFQDCPKVQALNVSNFNTAQVTDMSYMFAGCKALTSLDLSKFVTDNVTNMKNMFSSCENLTDLNISSFKTANVTDMSWMFQGCKKIETLDVTRFETQNVTDMNNMFANTSALKNLDVSNFSTGKVTNFHSMFHQTDRRSVLETLDVSHFDTKSATNMGFMFCGCTKLKHLDVSKFNTKNVTNMSCMFQYCYVVDALDVSKFNTAKVTDMSSMFDNCQAITTLDVSKFNTAKVKTFSSMFKDCRNLTGLDVSSFSSAAATTTYYMFYQCYKIETLKFGKNFTTKKVTNMTSMFHSCTGLKTLDVSKFQTNKAQYMENMFCGCRSLTELNVSNFNTSKNQRFEYMFLGVPVTRLDLRNFSVQSLTNTGHSHDIFAECENLKCIYSPKGGLYKDKTERDHDAFRECNLLVGGNGTVYDASNQPVTSGSATRLNGEYLRADGIDGKAGYLTYTVFMDNKLVEGKANNALRLDANEAGTPPGGVTLSNRTLFKDGHWNTLCLPFSLTAEEIASSPLAGATIMGLASSTLETKEFKFNFEEVTAIEAGKPYILKWESGENIKNPHFDKVTITSLEPQTVTVGEGKAQVQFIGTYDPAPLAKDDKTSFFVGSDDQLYYPNVENYQVNACRGYFKISDGVVAASRRVVLNFGNKLEGIGHIESSQATTSLDAQTAYDLQGRRVTNPTKGLYIVNGKKVMK